MNKFLIAAALAASVALGACSTTPGQITWPTIGQVQAAVALGCQFVPTASSIAEVIAAAAAGGAGSAVVSTADGIATAICAALKTVPTVQSANRFGASQASVAVKIGAKTVTVTGTYLVK